MLQWGAVERRPRRYDWAGYKQLFALVRALGLKLQVGIVAMCVLATIQSGAVSQLFALVRAPGLTHAAWCLPELAAALLARAMLIVRSPVHASASVAIPSGGHEVPRVPQCLSSCTKQSCFFFFCLCQVVMSFHACGGNVGDNAQIPLPQWVLQVRLAVVAC